VKAVDGTDAARRWEVLDGDRVRLSATIQSEVTGYGKAVVDPREYARDSEECTRVRAMAATYGEPAPQEPSPGGQPPVVKAVNMYEGEDEFAGEAATRSAARGARWAGGREGGGGGGAPQRGVPDWGAERRWSDLPSFCAPARMCRPCPAGAGAQPQPHAQPQPQP
jgi:hypothetical protein